jgi:hypothetical protein
VTQLIYPAVQANCIYEVCWLTYRTSSASRASQNVYLLGTSLARPVIARGMIAVADREGCECVSYPCSRDLHSSRTATFHTAALARGTTKSDLSSPSTASSRTSRSSRLGVSLVCVESNV